MIQPHRTDGYRPRSRVQLRIDDEVIASLDKLAESLKISRSHIVDVIMAIAVEEGGDWLVECIRHRLADALAKHRIK